MRAISLVIGAPPACTSANQLIQDYDVPVGGVDVDRSVPVADRLLGRYYSIHT